MPKKVIGKLCIGTSNIVVPGNKSTYPEKYRQKSRLHYYSSLLNSLEVNSSFYKVPRQVTFEKWSMDVADNFSFSVKLWKEITHIKRLHFEPDNIDLFLKAANGLGGKKGCLLVQFPGKITVDDYNKLEELLERITAFAPEDPWRIAIEFRNPSWYVGETNELLDEYGASLVVHDIPKSKNEAPNKGANFVYCRFHGPTGNYRGSYTDERLHQYYEQAQAWMRQGKDVYTYFNNTLGSALENVLQLKKIANTLL